MGVGERIKELRRLKGMTQAKLAEVVGVHEVTLRSWENGAQGINTASLLNLSLALGTTTSYLLGETDDPSPLKRHTERRKMMQAWADYLDGLKNQG